MERTAHSYGASLRVPLPPAAAGQWCRVRVTVASPTPWWAKLELTDEARGQVVREQFLGAPRGLGAARARETLVHVPRDSHDLTILLFGTAPDDPVVALQILPRRRAALLLARGGWRMLPAALWGSPLGLAGRVRALVGQAPARSGQAPPYATWIAVCEPPLLGGAPWEGQVAIVAGTPDATIASIAAAAAQMPDPSAIIVIAQAADWATVTGPWVVLLQAGEILRPGALAAFARAIAACPGAAFITADCDRLDAHGQRTDPLFKPGPDPLLLPTGITTRGACAIRWRNVPASLPLHGHAARLLLASRAPDAMAHSPGILSHIRPDYEPAPAAIRPAGPCRHAAATPPGPQPRVTMLVPSAARTAHVARCVGAIARGTAYPDFRIRLLLSAPDRASLRVLGRLRRHGAVSVVPLPDLAAAGFNYAAVNNAGAAAVRDGLLLLLNDDVAPIDAGWLDAMVAHMRDPAVGIVGARLLYGNGMVQHEGVIMGLANLCEHAGRLRPGDTPGLHGLALLDRQVSAATGACLLIRASLYHALGGMDEAYAVALNDVDLCLRARQAGWRLVYCAQAVLHHYESLSLGRHYAGDRAGLEVREVRRLRARFGGVIAADPFYSPLASLQPGREWQPAFPPRPHPQALWPSGHPPNPAAIV